MKQQHTLQPKVRFPEFEGDWKLTTIKEATNNHNNKRKPLKDSDRTDLDKIYPYYGASGIIDYVDEYLFDGEYLLLGEDGANIISRNSRLVFIAKGKFWVNNHAHVFSAKTNYDLRFLSDRLEYINYVIYNTGTAQPKLNSAVVANIEFNAPSLPEQQKIADYLSTIDTKINLLEEKKAQLALYKKAMMQKLFSQEIRFKPSEAEALEAYPEWEVLNGGDLFISHTNKNHNGDLDVLSITQDNGAIPRRLIDYKVQVSDEGVNNYKIVEKNDFIISLRSFQGGIEHSNFRGICSPAYIVLRNRIPIEPLFFKVFFKSKNYINNLNRTLEGIRDGKMISYSNFAKSKIPFPSLPEQQKIADFLSAIDESIEKVTEQMSQTQSFKKAMLQGMFV